MTRSLTRRVFGWLAGLILMAAAGMAIAQPQNAAAGTKRSATVLAAHPIVVSLAETLTEGSGIEILRAAPANLPYTRWGAYFAGRGAAALAREAARADAVLTLRSLWPDDPLYPLARRANIRMVEIDAARPIDEALADRVTGLNRAVLFDGPAQEVLTPERLLTLFAHRPEGAIPMRAAA